MGGIAVIEVGGEHLQPGLRQTHEGLVTLGEKKKGARNGLDSGGTINKGTNSKRFTEAYPDPLDVVTPSIGPCRASPAHIDTEQGPELEHPIFRLRSTTMKRASAGTKNPRRARRYFFVDPVEWAMTKSTKS